MGKRRGSGRPYGTESGPAWTAPRARAGPEAGPRRWTPRSCGPSGTSWQRRIGQRGRPGVPGEPTHREGGQGTDTSGDSAVRPRRAVPRRGDRGTKPSSSTISRLRRDRFRCRLSSGISSRVSSGPLYLVFTGATPRRGYPGRVLRQNGTAGPPGLPHDRGVRRPWLDSAIMRQGGRSSSSVSSAGCQHVVDGLRRLRRGRSGRNQGVAVGGLPPIQYVLHQGRVR